MCGRYALIEPDKIEERFYTDSSIPLKPNYNVAPTQNMPVIVSNGGKNHIELMHWGILRQIGKDIKKEIINTRADKALSPFWKKTVTQRRCLVPVNAFYEWKKTSEGKVPYLIGFEDRQLFAFAGIWSDFHDEKGNVSSAFSIMTTTPNKEMEEIHNRMPVILHPDAESLWLSDDVDSGLLEDLMVPYDNETLILTEVSKDVNNVRINNKEIMTPINSK